MCRYGLVDLDLTLDQRLDPLVADGEMRLPESGVGHLGRGFVLPLADPEEDMACTFAGVGRVVDIELDERAVNGVSVGIDDGDKELAGLIGRGAWFADDDCNLPSHFVGGFEQCALAIPLDGFGVVVWLDIELVMVRPGVQFSPAAPLFSLNYCISMR